MNCVSLRANVWNGSCEFTTTDLSVSEPPTEHSLVCLPHSWADADTALTNHNVPLETFFPPDTPFGRTQSLLCSSDRWTTVNAGIFMIRVSEDGIRLLSTLLAYPFVKDSEKHYITNGEQSSLAALLKNKHLREKIALVPAHWFNAVSVLLRIAGLHCLMIIPTFLTGHLCVVPRLWRNTAGVRVWRLYDSFHEWRQDWVVRVP